MYSPHCPQAHQEPILPQHHRAAMYLQDQVALPSVPILKIHQRSEALESTVLNYGLQNQAHLVHKRCIFRHAWRELRIKSLISSNFPKYSGSIFHTKRSLWKILPTNPSLANTPPWFFSSAMVVNSWPASSAQTQYMGRKQCSFTTCICLPKSITVCWTTWSLNTQSAIPRTWVSEWWISLHAVLPQEILHVGLLVILEHRKMSIVTERKQFYKHKTQSG